MNQIIKNTIILFVITLVAGICLGTVHDITLDPIAQAQEAAATKTYQEVTRMRQALMNRRSWLTQYCCSGQHL